MEEEVHGVEKPILLKHTRFSAKESVHKKSDARDDRPEKLFQKHYEDEKSILFQLFFSHTWTALYYRNNVFPIFFFTKVIFPYNQGKLPFTYLPWIIRQI